MSGVDHDTAKRMLDLAARAAWRGFGLVEPNPMVGCVISNESGDILAVGHHRRFGGPHAEVEAIRSARTRDSSIVGATAWVTLEPCATHGKTPPCVDAVLDAGIRRVVIACADPSESGGGAEALTGAGVDVQFSAASIAACRVSAPFRTRIQHNRPWIIAKWAQTVDGRLATGSGDSKWISCEASRRWVHRLRGRVDAVVVGIGTALADDPQLNARVGRAPRRVARRIVIDTRLRIPVASKLVQSAGDSPVTIVVSESTAGTDKAESVRALGVEVVGAPVDETGRVDLALAMQHLSQRHSLSNVLLESGPVLLGSFLAAGLVDEAAVFVAPRLMADERGQAITLGDEVNRIADARQLMLHRVRRSGDDALLLFSTRELTA